jgi:hypothetical protein
MIPRRDAAKQQKHEAISEWDSGNGWYRLPSFNDEPRSTQTRNTSSVDGTTAGIQRLSRNSWSTRCRSSGKAS